jgi:hypothetical protein
MGATGQRAAELAVSEFINRWKNGRGRETVEPFRGFVREYWTELSPGFAGRENDPANNPWSAAFISYIFKKSGALKKQFPFAAAHHTYIRRGDKNFLAGDLDADLVAFLPHEMQPEIGDLIVYWRGRQQSLRNLPAGGFKSHTDIVVRKRGKTIVTMGGNVRNNVGRKVLTLEATGHLSPRSNLMGILKVRF